MSAVASRDPVRTCIGCRSARRDTELVRITCADGARVVVGGASAGRGAWLCRPDPGDDAGGGNAGQLVAPACLDRALARRAFERAWRRPQTPDIEHELRLRLGGAEAHADER